MGHVLSREVKRIVLHKRHEDHLVRNLGRRNELQRWSLRERYHFGYWVAQVTIWYNLRLCLFTRRQWAFRLGPFDHACLARHSGGHLCEHFGFVGHVVCVLAFKQLGDAFLLSQDTLVQVGVVHVDRVKVYYHSEFQVWVIESFVKICEIFVF